MFIQTEATPNPATMKFLPGRSVLENGTLDLRDAEQAEQSPLAERLFGIPGVTGVFFGSDFITVTKSAGEWQQLKPMILGAIMEHFMSGAPLITGEATRVMSLRDGSKKMSKSDASDFSRINLTDDADAIAQKIRRAKTDPEPLPSDDEGLATRPEADNLVGIYAALADVDRAGVLKQFGNAQFSTFKAALTELAVAKLAPIGAEMKRLLADPAAIDAVLTDGAGRAQKLARQTMDAVKDVVGFVRSS